MLVWQHKIAGVSQWPQHLQYIVQNGTNKTASTESREYNLNMKHIHTCDKDDKLSPTDKKMEVKISISLNYTCM